MTPPHPFSDDELEPSIEPGEREALIQLAERLTHERPAPRAGFRSDLQAHIRGLGSSSAPRPAWLWQRVTALTLSGGGLLGLVALGVVRVGPFSP
jgi:hypothetical protein